MTILSIPICFMPATSRAGTQLIFVMSISLRMLPPETEKSITMVWLSRAFLPALTTLADVVNAASLLKNFPSAAQGSGGGPPGICADETEMSDKQPRITNAICFIVDLLLVR